jgi:hypothetical protein
MEDLFIYFLDNQDYLVDKYPGRYVIIKDNSILGDFDSGEKAARYAEEELELPVASFLIQKCVN